LDEFNARWALPVAAIIKGTDVKFSTRVYRLTLPLAVIVPFAAFAADDDGWNCTNADFEISCGDGKCTLADAHTPMSIDVSADEISWCAYSGCWTGPTSAAVTSGPFVSFHGLALENSTDSNYIVDVAIIIDTRSKSASVMASGLFTTPAICAPNQ
jgi:hypothetical protein